MKSVSQKQRMKEIGKPQHCYPLNIILRDHQMLMMNPMGKKLAVETGGERGRRGWFMSLL